MMAVCQFQNQHRHALSLLLLCSLFDSHFSLNCMAVLDPIWVDLISFMQFDHCSVIQFILFPLGFMVSCSVFIGLVLLGLSFYGHPMAILVLFYIFFYFVM